MRNAALVDYCSKTGTTKENWLSDSFYASRGIGFAHTGMAGISWSSANDPEFCAM
jgi:hypothetical protein